MSYSNPLIAITNVAGGWLTLQIERHSFDVSYLSDFKAAAAIIAAAIMEKDPRCI